MAPARHRRGLVVVAVLAGCGARPLLYRAPPPARDGQVALGGVHAEVAAALREAYRERPGPAPPPVPISLTAADGSEMELRALVARVQIEGPLAQTELRLTFHNSAPLERDGMLSIELPPGAAVAQLAALEGGVATPARGAPPDEPPGPGAGGFVPLDDEVGERRRLGLFTMPGAAARELVLVYDQEVSAVRPYRLALAGLPAVPVLRVAIEHDGAVREYERSRARPEDVVVPIAEGSQAVAAGGYFVARIEGDAGAAAPPAPLESVLVLVDTSASQAGLMERQAEVVRRVVAALSPDAEVAIAAFDHGVSEVYRGRAGGAGAGAGAAGAAVTALLEHGALGASDLGAALAYAAASGLARVVLVGEGTRRSASATRRRSRRGCAGRRSSGSMRSRWRRRSIARRSAR